VLSADDQRQGIGIYKNGSSGLASGNGMAKMNGMDEKQTTDPVAPSRSGSAGSRGRASLLRSPHRPNNQENPRSSEHVVRFVDE